MATIGNVNVSLGGDASGFIRTMGSVAGTLTSAIGKIGLIGSAISAAVAAIGTIGIGAMVNQVAGLGDEFLATSQKTGIAVETLSALKLAAKLNNAEFGDLTNGIKLMQRNLANADEEGQAAQQTLIDLGFTTADIAAGMKKGDVFLEGFAQKLAGIEDPAKRVQAAMAVMGRSGANLIPLLLDIADRGLGGIRRESDALGATFSTKLARASDAYRDNMDKLGAAMTGFKVTIIAPLVTALAALTTQFLQSDLFKGIRAQIDALANSGALEAWTKKILFAVIDFATKVPQLLANAVRAVGAFLQSIFSGAGGAIEQFFNLLIPLVTSGKTITLVLQTIALGFQAIAAGVKTVALPLAFVTDTLGITSGAFDKVFASLATTTDSMGALAARITENFSALQTDAQKFQGFKFDTKWVETAAQGLERVGTQVQQFGDQAKKSFDSVRDQVQKSGTEAMDFNTEVTTSRNAAGELVTSFVQVPAKIDAATGSAEALSSVFRRIQEQIREINANPVKPIQ